jgi:predicted ATPase/DNA-binding SARP family transcriptional activator
VSEISSSQPKFHLHFLGRCEISQHGAPVHLETAKTCALLIYLATNPGPQSRHTLMGLLWADLPEANARRNLRRALWNLRRQLPSPEHSPPILSGRETVCFNRESAYWSDVEAFEVACSYLGPAAPTPGPVPYQERVRHAAELYTGEFLKGFHVSNAAAFEEWAITERERLQAMALRAFQYVVADCAAQGENETALVYARRMLVLEPWLEEAHLWLMQLLARMGRRTEALAQYEACRRILAEELGVEPGRKTQTLHEEIRAGDFAIPSSNLPASTTPFVGRANELAEIAGLLARADCRLVTVTGLGGAGKTRLAKEAASRQVPAFAHGVHYLALSALLTPEQIATALAQSLSCPLIGTTDPKADLLAYLGEKQMLIVLDGFEHLLKGAVLLIEILQAAPGIKLLVTSRERLDLRGEWIYALAGLECAPDEQVGDLTSFDAVRLFLQTGHRVNLGFEVKDSERRHLVRICNLVGGLPLGIELAAAWVRVLSLEEIASEIAQHLDFLSASTRDRPERHRSIRAVFDHSWRLMPQAERDAFRKLSVFQGSFRAREAGQVGGASLHVLSSLVDKSLLQRLPSGRYQLHELLWQYAREQLELTPGVAETTRDLHCQVYVALAGRYEPAVKDVTHMPILAWIGDNMENVIAAWRWAIEHQDHAAIEAMYAGLEGHYHLTTSFREGEAFFRKALEDMGWMDGGKDYGLLPWKLRTSRATFSIYLGQLPQTRTSLERCLDAFAREGAEDEMAHCRFFLGEIARFVGEYASAIDLFELSLTGYRQVRNRSAIGFCLNGLGLVSAALNDLIRARSLLLESLQIFREADHEMGQAIASINLAELLIRLGDYPAAGRILDEGYALCRKLGHRWGTASCLRDQGDIARLEARPVDAKAAYQQSLGILQDIGQRRTSAGCLIKLGQVCTDLGELAEARQHLERALSLATELQDQTQMGEAAASLASLLDEEGGGRPAAELR